MKIHDAPSRTLLLVEPQFMMRRTVAMVAQQMNIARIQEATHHDAALRLLNERAFDGMLADMGDELAMLALVQRVREGTTRCGRELPIALMAERLDPSSVVAFKSLDVRRIMLKPFKVKTAIEVLSSISGVPLPA
jgi:DNA-binding NarL/FixJ family response regulator